MRFYTETRTTGWNSERCQAATPDHRCDNGGRRARERRQDVQAPLETVQARSRRRVGVNPAGAVSAGGLVKRPHGRQVGSSIWTRRPWHRGQAWRGAVTGARDGEPLRVEAGRISEHPPPKTA